jgi:thioredoxin 1
MSKLIIGLLIGGGIGAALGYFGQCTTGTCPLTANWKRGALVGAVLGMVFSFNIGGTASRAATESSAHVKRIAEAEFEGEVLQSSSPVVVDFYADWCGPCRRLAPRLDKVAGQFSGHVKVVKVNVDQASGLARRYDIQGIPALKFFKSGAVVGGAVGLPSEPELQGHFRRLTGSLTRTDK